VVGLLRELKKEATLLVVSHDLADIAPLVDCAWRMQVRARVAGAVWRVQHAMVVLWLWLACCVVKVW
jgi:energy-coupling factor transporter ATP-binding protein EcfA2